MDALSRHGRKDVGFAIIRNYQPTRIERELLAQVFEIVGRGSGARLERSADCQKPAVIAAETIVTEVQGESQYDALEAVA